MEKRAIEDQAGDPQRLQEAHTMLDRRVKELDRRAFLTPAEQQELTDLKKRKLALKDAIRNSQPPPEPMSS